MARRLWLSAALAVAAQVLAGELASASLPVPDPAALSPAVPGSPCTATTPYEQYLWAQSASAEFGSSCTRIHFRFGPLYIKAGQMDAVVQPVTIEKPAYDGYITRFRPDLQNPDGTVPDIVDVHLHHGTWLNLSPQYGNGPFFAAGEEKTILDFPRGYGMPVNRNDTWLLLYMVHNQTPQPRIEYVTYDVDFVAKATGDAGGIDPVKPIWLDVQHKPITASAPDRSAYPVFNAQRGFGHVDPATGRMECSWPRENCARFDSFGAVTPQQGVSANVGGADWVVPPDMAGSIVGLGGHLHPGGVSDDISLVRNGVEKPIFTSQSIPWSRTDHSSAGGPRNSWDFSMTVTGTPLGWKVAIKPGDIVRLNATYDTQDASWYENMGIVMAFVAPHDTHLPAPVDVFDPNVTIDPGVSTKAMVPPGMPPPTCTPSPTTLCLGGMVTHGHLPEAQRYGGCPPPTGCGVVDDKPGPITDTLVASGFTYTTADLGVVGTTGIPRLRAGVPAHFYNADSGADVWHTFTLCTKGSAVACDGATGLSYPLASGGSGQATDTTDFDSTEIGIGTFYSSARGQIGGSGPQTQIVQEGTEWVYTPTVPGVYQFFCRVHPSMRGVFWVIPSGTSGTAAAGPARSSPAANSSSAAAATPASASVAALRVGRPW
jgi:hypothetical protein